NTNAANFDLYIDGIKVATVTCNAAYQKQVIVYENTTLDDKEHYLKAVSTSTGSTLYFSIDAWDIDSNAQIKSYSPIGTLGQTLPGAERGWQRIEETNTKIQYNGTWNSQSNSGYSGGTSKYSVIVGNTVKFSFTGTKLRLIGMIQPSSGGNGCESIEVNIDGAVVGTYAQNTSLSGYIYSALCYENTNLSNTDHIVTLTYKGSGGSKQMHFDAFDIDSTASVQSLVGSVITAAETGWQRFDQNNAAFGFVGTGWTDLSYAGAYNSNCKYSDNLSDIAQFNFTGPKLRLVTFTTNIACNKWDVYIDGSLVASLNLYSSAITGQVLVYNVTNLENIEHYVQIVNSYTNTSYKRVYFDCIDIATGNQLKSYDPNAGVTRRYLIQDGSATDADIKYISSGLWNTISGKTLATIDESDYTTNGMPLSTLTSITNTQWNNLSHPDDLGILCYSSGAMLSKAKITAAPKDQLIVTKSDIDLTLIYSITSMMMTATTTSNGKISIVCSPDSGANWYTNVSGSWQTISLDVNSVVSGGMSLSTFNAVSNWDSLPDISITRRLRLAYALSISASTDTAQADQLNMTYTSTGKWKYAILGTDYDCEYGTSNKLAITFITTGQRKVNIV
ncbi:MAG: hypothetical protein Q8880_13405, partial [Bacteroidota bacterium]|nr:hypothetical protein [Bacteroidota bacterium]